MVALATTSPLRQGVVDPSNGESVLPASSLAPLSPTLLWAWILAAGQSGSRRLPSSPDPA
ncbi:hypothetical protein E2C01_072955 [Portunus trituberculatus]|uniref:Uncharacterized protein n=1 Tax=Portunus trituberculatus TaxID=210409 RepID=A0A5B7IC27_PORTR|nr:hypothetical protein [Portunus trituberculatus]